MDPVAGVRQPSILIVEEIVMIRNMLRMALITQGYEVLGTPVNKPRVDRCRSRPEAFIQKQFEISLRGRSCVVPMC